MNELARKALANVNADGENRMVRNAEQVIREIFETKAAIALLEKQLAEQKAELAGLSFTPAAETDLT